MRQGFRTVVVVLLVALTSAATLSCRSADVKVRSGLRTVCKYDHVIADTTRYVNVDPAKASQYKVREETTVCAAHRKAEELYAKAKKALAAGKKKTAKTLLAQVVAADPAFEDAASKYKALGGKMPSKGTATGTGSSPSASNPSNKPKPSPGTGMFLSRINVKPAGYRLVSQSEDMISGTKFFAATNSSKPGRLLTVQVEWLGNKTKFWPWYVRRLKPRYYSSWGKTQLTRRRTGYYGTDADKFGNLCWSTGGYVFQVELEARKGRLSRLKSEAVAIANKI